MSEYRLPLRPNLDQLKRQSKDLLRRFRSGAPDAVEQFKKHHPANLSPADARLADAQLVLARAYEASSWPRLAVACRLINAIWEDEADAVREIVRKQPTLLHEQTVLRKNSNWGPPMSYAANLGRERIVRLLHELGATDHAHALDRATLQGHSEIARMLHGWMGNPRPAPDALNNPAYTLSVSGTALMLELGASVVDVDGRRLAPVDVVLETDSRIPRAKHEILEMYVRHGLTLPDTPPNGRASRKDRSPRRTPSA